MNALLERFLALEPRQKLLVVVGIPVLIFILYYVLVLSPRRYRIGEFQQRIVEMTVDRERKQAETADMAERARAVDDLDRSLALAMTRLPDEKEIPDLLSSISSLGRDSGLDILTFRQRPEAFEEFYARVPVDMEVRGTYHQVAAFLDRVGRLDRIVNVSDIVVEDPEVVGGDVVLRANSRVTTFRFLDEVERKRLAEDGTIEGKQRTKVGAEK